MAERAATASAGSGPARAKRRAALLSIGSNAVLIALKVVAGSLTGSVAILTEAMHSGIDLIASLVAWLSIRKAGEPADESHRYGHEKVENLASAVEGLLILVGSAIILYEAVRRLSSGAELTQVPLGIAVIGLSIVVNVAVSAHIARVGRATESPALEGDAAHLHADALTSGGVLAGLVLVQLTGWTWVDPVVAMIVAAGIVVAGVRLLDRSSRVLVDESLPAGETEAIRETLLGFGPRGVAGYHELRTRRAGARRHVDLHVQFRKGTTLEDAHAVAHELQDAIRARLPEADVLIHLEPEDRVRAGGEVPPGPAAGASADVDGGR